MCNLNKKSGTTRIDLCLVEEIDLISQGEFKTLCSCCGHGKYSSTIVVLNKLTGEIFEWNSGIELGERKRNRYYKKDKEGFYFIPK